MRGREGWRWRHVGEDGGVGDGAYVCVWGGRMKEAGLQPTIITALTRITVRTMVVYTAMVLQMRDTWSFQSSRIGSSSTGVRTTTTLFHQLLTCRITGSLLIAHRRQQDEPVLSTEAPSGSCAPYSSGTASRGVPSKRSTLSAEVPLLMFINRAQVT